MSSDFGRINLQHDESSYVESDHWMAILDEIGDLRNMANDQSLFSPVEDHGYPAKPSGTDLFLLRMAPTTKVELIGAMPPRSIVDGIIAQYFRTADMPATLIIHRRVFFKQYESFWKDPPGTPIMWMTMLFGMMYVVAYTSMNTQAGQAHMDEDTTAAYRHIVMSGRGNMIQCLRIGDYMKGTPHTIEALLSFLQIEYIQGKDTKQGLWQLMGVILRVAFKMGYHRDGSHFPHISVWEAEMRRRTWYILKQFDIATASQAGLPRMIKDAQCDTAEPRSLFDDDFDDTTTILPPARPETQHTLVQFLIHKSRIISIYGMICDFTASSDQRNYLEAMRLDGLLITAYTQTPGVLRLKSMQQSITDGTDLITRRLFMAMSFHHAQMTLHRKFMILAKTNSRYTYSHSTCVDAALTALRLQADLFEQCQPGYMLYADQWKILSLTQSEFLLATTILCVNLDDDITHKQWEKSPLSGEKMYSRSVEALQAALRIWKQQQDISKEAQTAVRAISFVLDKAKAKSASATPCATAMPDFDFGIADCGSEVNSLLPHTLRASMSVPADPQVECEEVMRGDFFDMDFSWDAWLQF